MTNTATYTFHEALTRVGDCTELWELLLLSEVLMSERKEYSLYELCLIETAIRIMTDVVGK